MAEENKSTTTQDKAVDPASALLGRLERVVANLADPIEWNWTRMMSHRDAANCMLALLSIEGLIEHANHPLGGSIWRLGDRMFGRLDGIDHKRFDELKRSNNQTQATPPQPQ
jgi:hypothetical protein